MPPPPPPNSAPTITANTNFIINERQTVIGRFTVNDVDNDILTYSISGPDAALFSVSRTSEVVLSARTPLDFDDPSDANGNNVYEITVSVSDGSASASADLLITVEDIAADGIARLAGVQRIGSAGDLTGDGIDDFLALSQTLYNEASDTATVGHLIFRSAIVSETPLTYTLSFLAEAPAVFRGALEFRSTPPTPFQGSTVEDSIQEAFFLSGFTRTGGGDTIEYATIVSDNLITPSPNNLAFLDSTAFFPDLFSSAFSGAFFRNLSTEAFPNGVRSTRDGPGPQARSVWPVGDFNGDGISEAVIDNTRNAAGNNSYSDAFSLADGALLRAAPEGLFDSVTDTLAQTIIVAFDEDIYLGANQSRPFSAYRKPGTADINGDGVDDMVTSSRRRSAPNSTTASETIIYVLSGSELIARPAGVHPIEDFAFPEALTITAPAAFDFLPNVAGLGDLNNDGFADLLITTYRGDPDDGRSAFEAYIVSGAALTNAPGGTLSLTDFPGPNGTAIRISQSPGQALEGAFMIESLFGGPGEEIVLLDSAPDRSTGEDVPFAAILSDALFDNGFPAILELSDPDSFSVREGLAALPRGTVTYVVGIRVRPETVDVPNFGLARFGSSTFTTGSASIGDGDGDGLRDLALVNETSRRESDDSFDTIIDYNTFIIPSGRITAALESDDPVDLNTEFE